jgi:hypothetical protein
VLLRHVGTFNLAADTLRAGRALVGKPGVVLCGVRYYGTTAHSSGRSARPLPAPHRVVPPRKCKAHPSDRSVPVVQVAVFTGLPAPKRPCHATYAIHAIRTPCHTPPKGQTAEGTVWPAAVSTHYSLVTRSGRTSVECVIGGGGANTVQTNKTKPRRVERCSSPAELVQLVASSQRTDATFNMCPVLPHAPAKHQHARGARRTEH